MHDLLRKIRNINLGFSHQGTEITSFTCSESELHLTDIHVRLYAHTFTVNVEQFGTDRHRHNIKTLKKHT